MNWGHKIAFLYIGFVVLMLTLVTMSMRQNFDLVTEDYYEKEQNYMVQVQHTANSKSLDIPLEIKYEAKKNLLLLQFPNDLSSVEGSIEFYRPSNATKDFTLEVAVDEYNEQWIPTDELLQGIWKVRIHWRGSDQTFFDEREIWIQ